MFVAASRGYNMAAEGFGQSTANKTAEVMGSVVGNTSTAAHMAAEGFGQSTVDKAAPAMGISASTSNSSVKTGAVESVIPSTKPYDISSSVINETTKTADEYRAEAEKYKKQMDEAEVKYKEALENVKKAEEQEKLKTSSTTTSSSTTSSATTVKPTTSSPTIGVSSQGGSDFSSGAGVKMNTSAVMDISNKMSVVMKDVDEQYSSVIADVINRQNECWRGQASNRLYDDLKKKTNEIYPESVDKIMEYLNAVNKLVEDNIQTGKEIVSKEITKTAMEKDIKGVDSGEVGRAIDSTLLNSVAANENVKPVVSEVEARPLDMDLLNSVHIDGSIFAPEANVNAPQVDTQLNDSVHVDNAVKPTTDKTDNYFDNREATEVKTENLFSSNLSSSNEKNIISDIAKSISEVDIKGGE